MTAGNTRFELVVATSENGIIGDQGGMPWHLPRDLRQFKSLTMGHPIVMGRRTWESIGRPLPGRRNIVLTRDRDYVADGADVVHSVEDIVQATDGDAVVMIIGGGRNLSALLEYGRHRAPHTHSLPRSKVIRPSLIFHQVRGRCPTSSDMNKTNTMPTP